MFAELVATFKLTLLPLPLMATEQRPWESACGMTGREKGVGEDREVENHCVFVYLYGVRGH